MEKKLKHAELKIDAIDTKLEQLELAQQKIVAMETKLKQTERACQEQAKNLEEVVRLSFSYKGKFV